MAQKTEGLLRKAVMHIRAGNAGKARPFLVDLLRKEPKNAQAWYLLSFTLDDPQQQQYAVLQALRIDPEFERGRKRLSKLRGELVPAPKPPFDEEPAAPPIVMELGSEKLMPAFVEGSEQTPEAELPTPDEPGRKRPPFKFGRYVLFLFLFLLLAALLIAAINFFPSLTFTRPTSTAIATRTLPATWTPSFEPTATASRTPAPSSTPTIEPSATTSLEGTPLP